MEEEWRKIEGILVMIQMAHLLIIYLIWILLRSLEQKVY